MQRNFKFSANFIDSTEKLFIVQNIQSRYFFFNRGLTNVLSININIIKDFQEICKTNHSFLLLVVTSRDFLDVFWSSYQSSIYALCPGVVH